MSIVKHQSKHNGNVVQVPGKATINGTAFVISIALNELPTLKYCTLKGPQKILKAKTYDVNLGLWILRKRRLKIAQGFLTQGDVSVNTTQPCCGILEQSVLKILNPKIRMCLSLVALHALTGIKFNMKVSWNWVAL